MIAEEGKEGGERLAKSGPPFWYPRPPPLTIKCGECGHTDEYGVYCNASIGDAHVRCKGCNACFVVGVEKGDPTDISACTKHKAEDSEEEDEEG
jgi:hypothetical protein